MATPVSIAKYIRICCEDTSTIFLAVLGEKLLIHKSAKTLKDQHLQYQEICIVYWFFFSPCHFDKEITETIQGKITVKYGIKVLQHWDLI